MAVTTQIYQPTQLDSLTSYREQAQKVSRTQSGWVAPIFKAALFGGLSQATLLGLGLLPLPAFMSILVIAPTFVLVYIFTGMLATHWADDCINCAQKGGQVAWMAGFWAGVFTAITAMALAANGMLLAEFGQGTVELRTPEQLELLSHIISAHTLALTGRVLGALLLYGLIGSLGSALISAFGGMVCYKLSLTYV